MIVTAVVATFLALALVGLASGRRQLMQAQSDLRAAARAVTARDDAAARAALESGGRRLRTTRRRSRAIPLAVLRPVPVLGAPGRALREASEAGLHAVAAGRAVLEASSSFPTSGSATLDGHDLSAFHDAAVRSGDALAVAEARAKAASGSLAGAVGAVLPQVSGPARTMRAELERNRRQLDGVRRGLALLSDLTGPDADARLLVLSQDTLELRPTGGYIGSYGVLRFSSGTVALEKYEATEDLPPPAPPMQPPAALEPVLPQYWALSNANWWPDFPTSAAVAREMYSRQGGGQVDGVLALTEHTLSRLVGALGSVQVPGYPKPVVEAGFDQRAVYEVELKRPQDTPRKRFLIELAKIVFDRVFKPAPDRFAAMVAAVDRSVGAGDVQLWFADTARQAQLRGAVVSGAVPATDGDFLMLVDANVSASKANAGLVKKANYRVTRQRDGTLLAHLDVVVTNVDPESGVNPYYNGYLRVYTPAGAELLRLGADQGQQDPDSREGPHEVFTQLLLAEPRGEQKVSFDYRLPARVDADGRYRLTWARQVGTSRDTLEVAVAGRSATVGPDERMMRFERDLRGNRLVEWLRDRWIVQKLGV